MWPLVESICVSTLISESLVVNQVYWGCIVTFMWCDTITDLIFLDMVDFYMMLGMDWLLPHHAIVDYLAKIVTLSYLNLPQLVLTGASSSYLKGVIYYMHAYSLMEKGFLSYLPYVQAYSQKSPSLETTRVVREFMDVFLTDLLSLPLDGDIDFTIDMVPKTKPISVGPPW